MNNIQLVTKQYAHEIAMAASDGYSFTRYGERAWKASAVLLARRGLTARQIEAVLRSKWMRWAADHGLHTNPTSKDLERFLDDPNNAHETTIQHINDMAAGRR